VAAALDIEPGLPALLADVTVMGGAIACGGNATAAAEANVAHDPLAALQVIEAFGAPGALASGRLPRLVPLDVTTMSALTVKEKESLDTSPIPGAGLLAAVWDSVWAMAELESAGEGLIAHDLLAMCSITEPDLLTWENLPLTVDVAGGAAWGATVADRRFRVLDAAPLDDATKAGFAAMLGVPATRWSIATDVDVERYRQVVRDWLSGNTPVT
jgi:purine nucleosidase